MASGLFVAGGGRTGHLLGRARVAQAENDEEHGPTGAVGRTIKGAQEAILEILAKWMAGSHLTKSFADLLQTVHSGDLVKLAASNAIAFSTRLIAIFAYIMSSVFLALYIMIDRDRLRGGFFLVVPRTHHIRLSRVMLNLETIVGGYIRGLVITSALMAVLAFIPAR